jgi:hypothetical protein
MSGPANEVFNAPYPNYGTEAPANAPGNMGAEGAYNPSGFEWNPRGLGNDLGQVLSAVNYGQAPSSHGHVTFKSFDFVSMQYMTAPTTDKANLMIKRGMPCFMMREFDKEDNSHIIYPLFMLNQLSKDQWRDFVLGTDTNSPMQDPDKLEFLGWMRKYGDDELCEYASAKRTGDMTRYGRATDEALQELAAFLARAEEPGYCYLTKYGWSQKVNFVGANINTNLGAGLESLLDTENMPHYVNANQGYAKRILMGQCFGTAQEVTMGSTLWIVLRREYCHNGKYGPFILFPGASRKEANPRNIVYIDEKGKTVDGIVYKVGTVLEPADKGPQKSTLEQANNINEYGSTGAAYESFGELPTFYVNMGFKQ